MNQHEQEAVLSLLHRLERRWVPAIPDAPTRHAWDPLPFWSFLEGVAIAEPHVRVRSFLDVGCGIGQKVALMHHLGWKVAGLDWHAPYVDAARQLCNSIYGLDLQVADAFDVDRFDAGLVYLYRPMRSDEDEERLEAHVIKKVVPGTVVFLPARRFRTEWGDPLSAEVGVKR